MTIASSEVGGDAVILPPGLGERLTLSVAVEEAEAKKEVGANSEKVK